MENSKAVVTFSCFHLFSTDKRSTAEEDCYAKLELVKHFFVCLCVLEKLSHPEGKWFKSENERSKLQLLDVWNGS